MPESKTLMSRQKRQSNDARGRDAQEMTPVDVMSLRERLARTSSYQKYFITAGMCFEIHNLMASPQETNEKHTKMVEDLFLGPIVPVCVLFHHLTKKKIASH